MQRTKPVQPLPNAHTHSNSHTLWSILKVPETGRARWWMCYIYFLQTQWTEGQGRPSVTAHFSPYFNRDVCAFPGCCPVFVSCSSVGPGAWFSLPICPSADTLSLGLVRWQPELLQWWMTALLASVSESRTPVTCRAGPCQRLPVRSAIFFHRRSLHPALYLLTDFLLWQLRPIIGVYCFKTNGLK